MPLVSTQNNSFSTLHIWPLKHSKEKKKNKEPVCLTSRYININTECLAVDSNLEELTLSHSLAVPMPDKPIYSC